jgi:dipeptidyl aminopeptidase/acylaminoacyl peptidase
MRSITLCSPLLTFCFAFTPLLTAQAAKRPMAIDDLSKLQEVGRPVISPDGAFVAYTVTTVDTEDDKNVTHLWMVSWDGTQDVQLTYGTESAGEPRWSPDGKYLAFTSSRPGKAKGDQVWVFDRRGGEARQLTDVKDDLLDYRWSPDAKQLLLTLQAKDEPDEDEKDKDGKPKPPQPIVIDRFHFKQDVEGYLTDKHAHLFLYDIASGKLNKLTAGPDGADKFDEEAAEWSPDGMKIAFVSNHDLPDPDRTQNTDVFVVEAKAGASPRRVTTFTGTDAGPLAWSPDSKLIAYREGVDPKYTMYDVVRLAIAPAAGGEPTILAPKLDRNVSAPVFTEDGKSLLTTIEDDRIEYVAEVPAAGGDLQTLAPHDGVASRMAQAGGHVATLWSNDTLPVEIYAVEDGKLRALTHHNQTLVAQLNLSVAENIAAKEKDGTDVHGLLTMPPGYQPGTKVPMLLLIHGGPDAQDAHEFDDERQLFAAHGYAVLHVNYRGSNGRGHAWAETIAADWGDKEVKDLLAAVDAAVATGKVDPDKLIIGGWSYGGILTDYSIATTTRFKAASSGAGMGNLFGLYGVDEYVLQYEYELQPPWKNTELYLKLSYPFLHADRIKTPTLFMGGDKDFNVPLVGGEQMYESLKSVGTPTEIIVYPGQFHGFTRPSFIRDRYTSWFGWYDKYLGRTSTSPSTH